MDFRSLSKLTIPEGTSRRPRARRPPRKKKKQNTESDLAAEGKLSRADSIVHTLGSLDEVSCHASEIEDSHMEAVRADGEREDSSPLPHEDEMWPEMPFESLGDNTRYTDNPFEQPHPDDIQPQSPVHLPPHPDDIMESIKQNMEIDNNNNIEQTEAYPADGLDPDNSERRYHRHPHTGQQREIWRPGDGDGDQGTEYYNRKGPALPLEKRWRLFQSDIGPIGVDKNMPPKFVFLDDRAAYEVINSDLSKAKMSQWWPHEFGQPVKIRKSRPHIGRPAIKNPNAEGEAKYHSTQLQGKGGIYYFSGEKDYKPVIYLPKKAPSPTPSEVEAELSRKRKAESPPYKYNPRSHGHNQYTPKDMMVKHGAKSFSRKPPKEHDCPPLPRASSMMKSTQSPVFQEKRLFGGMAENARESVAMEARHRAAARAASEASSFASGFDQSVPPPPHPTAPSPRDTDSPDDDFPTRRPEAAQGFGQGLLSTPGVQSSRTAAPLGDLDVPRNMGFIERRAIEQQASQQIISSIQGQEDVKRIADELAQEKVKVGQKSKQLEKLERDLEQSQSINEGLIEELETQKMKVGELELQLKVKEQECEALKKELHAQQTKNVQLELKIDKQVVDIQELRNTRWVEGIASVGGNAN